MQIQNVRIQLSHEDNAYIEKLWYEYNAKRDVVGFLMEKDKVNEAYLQEYLNVTEAKYAELELAKQKIDLKYRPKDITNLVGYSFDFEKEELVYEIGV